MALSRLSKFSFAAGVLATIGVALPPLWFIERRLGLAHLWNDVSPFRSPRVDLPPAAMRAELNALGAVPDNVPDFSDAPAHQTFLVRPDAELEYVLRPNVRGSAYILRTRQDFNLDPPVIYIPSDAVMSKELGAYLDRETRVRYGFSTTADGLRTTLPAVSSPRRVLLVGDSVGFGLGVDDDATMASQLQASLGNDLQIVNAAVGGYGADQIFRVADKQTAARAFDALIYVANANDYEADLEQDVLALASDNLRRLAKLTPRVGNRVVVLLTGYLEYAVRDIFNPRIHGWTGPWVRHAGFLRAGLPAVAAELGFQFVDMHQLVDDTVQSQGTIFSPFGLFVDHAHLSRQGNRIAATALRAVLANLGIAPAADRSQPISDR